MTAADADDWGTLAARGEALGKRATVLEARRAELQRAAALRREKEAALRERIGRADAVQAALQTLTDQLFGDIVALLQEKLSIALREVLGQELTLRIDRKDTATGARMDFVMVRGGEEENVMHGQGGSVANVLSVGLRIFSLFALDPARHRPFLLLDEQDCWLRPDLVPALVRIVREAGGRLGVQTLMISHHDLSLFEGVADRLLRFDLVDGRVVVRASDRADHGGPGTGEPVARGDDEIG